MPVGPATPSRRSLLLAAGGGLALAGCSFHRDEAPASKSKVKRIRYGSAPMQYADLRLPKGTPQAMLVVIHGGGYLPRFSASVMNPLAEALTGLGYATWNLEYRRIGSGGGYPQTFEDVAAGIDKLKGTPYAGNVVTLGHSAGGHLAVWAASRNAKTPGGESKVPLRGAISLSGGLDFLDNTISPDIAKVVAILMGGTPAQVPQRYALIDPTQLLPAHCPVWAAQATGDTVIPHDEASNYVARAKRAGGTATYVPLPGTHGQLINPAGSAFPGVKSIVKQATH